ncbi:MAG TPA: response regulator transcription factor [Steroidobacteraceae bacterium]|jgi:DNA-binding NarL/FixJ family response regulator
MIEPAADSLRIVIGENNPDLAGTLRLLLDAEPDMQCVAIAASSRDILAAIAEHSPNAFIIDLSLDDGSSLPLIPKLRQQRPAAAIVVFTGHKNEVLSEHCLQAGADAVVVKSGAFEELAAALRASARRASARDGAARSTRDPSPEG